MIGGRRGDATGTAPGGGAAIGGRRRAAAAGGATGGRRGPRPAPVISGSGST
jgi:hypothetical protein